LPSSIIAALRLAWSSRQHGLLADGKVVLFDIYSASVMWDGQPRTVRVAAADTRPLLGMSMLARHSLMIDVVSGGAVSITALP
jgi:predicted aspartyl protease